MGVRRGLENERAADSGGKANVLMHLYSNIDGIVGLMKSDAESVSDRLSGKACSGCEMLEKGVFCSPMKGDRAIKAFLHFYGRGLFGSGLIGGTDGQQGRDSLLAADA